ncbi:MAG: hypothetical protein QXD31_02255 [Candidatus Caldarchaeum sp.]
MISGYIFVESLLVVALIISASAFSSTMLTTFKELEQNNKMNLNQMMRRLQTRLEPVFSYVSDNLTDVYLWIKNVGVETLSHAEIEMSEIFITGRNLLVHLSRGKSPPSWNYEIVRDVFPDQGLSRGETLKITVKLVTALQPGEYLVRFVTPYSTVEHVFSVGG